MNLLHRYIFRSVGLATLTGIGLFVFVLIAGNAVRDVLELLASGQLTFDVFVRLMSLLLPWTASFAAPLGLLIGILVVLGRMSARHEIVAMKAAGISIWRISAPILALAMLLTLASSFINNYYAPTARTQYRAVLENIVREDPLRFIVPGRFVRDFPGYVIYAGGREGDSLTNFWVWEMGDEGQVLHVLRARTGVFTFDADSDALILTLGEGFVEIRSQANPDAVDETRPLFVFEDWRLRLPLENILRRAGRMPTDLRQRKLSNMSLPDLLTLRSRYEDDMARPGLDEGEAARLEMERTRASYYISRNFAFSFSTLALAMLAIPLGIQASRTETYANLGIAVGLALFYYFLEFLVGMLERNPAALPQVMIWLPNFAFQAVGLYLMVRSNRH